jgi:hypothetical protein
MTMDWTAEQITGMCTGRPTYRDQAQGAALTWVRAGDEAVVPPRAVHGWQVTGDRTLRFVPEVRPAHAGFEKWLVTLQVLAGRARRKGIDRELEERHYHQV